MRHREVAFKAVVGTLGVTAALVFASWALALPEPVHPARGELPILSMMMLRPDIAFPGYGWLPKAFVAIVAATSAGACALAAMLAWRAGDREEIRRLALALALAAAGAAYFFVVQWHEPHRAAFAWTPTSLARPLWDFAGYAAMLLATVFLVRFFIGYPRAATPEAWLEFYRDENARVRAKMGDGWRRWAYPGRLAVRMARSPEEARSADTAVFNARLVAWAQRPGAVWLAIGCAAAAAAADAYVAHLPPLAPAVRPPAWEVLLRLIGMLSCLVALMSTWGSVASSLRMHAAHGTPEDRARIDWIKATLLSGGVVVLAVQASTMVATPFVMASLAARDVFIPLQVAMVWPMAFASALLTLAFVVALALSVFYRGAIDPRLAARKFTLFGLMGLFVAFVFVLVERTVAQKVVQLFGLGPDMGALIAGAAVAASIAPVKARAEKLINAIVARYLPIEGVVGGERKVAAVASTGLAGYDELAARDAERAMLLNALLQRQAQAHAGVHGARAHKAGHGVVHVTAADAAAVLATVKALHAGFAAASLPLGLEPLPLHSAAHQGELTESAEGELYGPAPAEANRRRLATRADALAVTTEFAAAAAVAPGEALVGAPAEAREA